MRDPDPTAPGASRSAAILALLVVTVLWGGTFVWMKQGILAIEAELGPGRARVGIGLFMALRFGIAAAVLAVIAPSSRRSLSREAWTGGFWLGGLLFGGFALQMMGLEEVTPAVSAFLTSLYVLFTAVLSAGLSRRGPSVALFTGAVLATLGAGFIRGRPELDLNLGELLTVGCALLFALHILATDRITKRVPPMPVTLTSFVVVTGGSLVLVATSMLEADAPAPADLARLVVSPGFAVPLVLSCLLATVLALSLMNLFQRRLDPIRAAVLYALEPIWASLFGIASRTDAFSTSLWLGGSLLLAGNLVAELGQSRKLRSRVET